MKTVPLGKTDLKVSSIAFGAWELGGEWGSFYVDEAVAAIRRARTLGINLFDTAQGYGFGASERLLATALRDDLDHSRADVVIATKGGLGATVSQLAVAWVLGNPAVDAAIVGTRNAEHVAQAVAAADLVLSAGDRSLIDAVVALAVPVGGPSCEAMP